MKLFARMFVVLLVLALLPAASWAVDAATKTRTVLNAVTATGPGSAVCYDEVLSNFSVVVIWGGTAPTNTVIALEGSIDGGTTWGAWATSTITASGTYFHAADKPAFCYRGNYVSKTGGDGTTTVTMRVLSK